MDYVRSLPINDTPEIFGLHENANITFAQNDTYALLGSLLLLQPKSSSGAGSSREDVRNKLKCITWILTMLHVVHVQVHNDSVEDLIPSDLIKCVSTQLDSFALFILEWILAHI